MDGDAPDDRRPFNDHELAADKILIAAGKEALHTGPVRASVMGGLGSLVISRARRAAQRHCGTAASVAERTEGALAKIEGAAAAIESAKDDGGTLRFGKNLTRFVERWRTGAR